MVPRPYSYSRPATVDSPILLSGPSALRAASRIRTKPTVLFPWDLAPADSLPIYAPGSIEAPAVGVQAIVTSYIVPDGYQFALKARLNVYQGAGQVIGSPSVTWTTDVNTPLGGSIPQGWPVENMAAELWPVGSFASGPWPVMGYLVFTAQDVIRVKVLTNADITPGAPNYFISALMGWIWPLR